MMYLNCDLGEGFGVWKMGMDDVIMPLINQANIACGFHASDPTTMTKTVELAVSSQVTIGAHPAYPDLMGFGRRSMACTKEELKALIWYQVGALEAICRSQGARVDYVKPHGALNNDMMKDNAHMTAVMEAVAALGDKALMIPVTVHHQAHRELGAAIGVPIWFEAFADRAYTNEGQLVSRSIPGSVYHDDELIVNQALSFSREGGVTSIDGHWLDLPADTLCIHGDNEASIAVVRRIRDALDQQQ
ncbi:MAG: 5-oxoprolinase subunit PxpA [Saccharospirillum sp.]